MVCCKLSFALKAVKTYMDVDFFLLLFALIIEENKYIFSSNLKFIGLAIYLTMIVINEQMSKYIYWALRFISID